MRASSSRAHSFRALVLVICGVWCSSFGNQPPSVNAGADQDSVGTNDRTFLTGTISDDSTPDTLWTIQWSQVSGPVQAQILSPNTAISQVKFTQAGTYAFELRVGDGTLSAADTTRITVHLSLPFIVLHPVNNEQVQIGKPYVARWQMDPSVGCRVECSMDGGRTFTVLSADGAVTDSFTWNVDSSLAPGANGIIRVSQYLVKSNNCSGTFTLVDHPPQGVRSNPRAGRSCRMAIDNLGGVISVSGLGKDAVATLRVFHATGASVLAATVRNGRIETASPGLASRGMLLYQLVSSEGALRYGRLVNMRQ